jgi:hypothetical protein
LCLVLSGFEEVKIETKEETRLAVEAMRRNFEDKPLQIQNRHYLLILSLLKAIFESHSLNYTRLLICNSLSMVGCLVAKKT